jgi:hypothetical protein
MHPNLKLNPLTLTPTRSLTFTVTVTLFLVLTAIVNHKIFVETQTLTLKVLPYLAFGAIMTATDSVALLAIIDQVVPNPSPSPSPRALTLNLCLILILT